MNVIRPKVPEGWTEREPEQLEKRLFVSTETFTDGLFEGVAKEHIAIYAEDRDNTLHYTLEYYYQGEYEFEKTESEAEATEIVTEWMQQSRCVT